MKKILKKRKLKLKRKEFEYSQHSLKTVQSNDSFKKFLAKSCCCFSKCFSKMQYTQLHHLTFRIEAVTCNKLSHCLFDFDCPNFDQYENEKYEFQHFKFQNLYSCTNETKLLTLMDLSIYRDEMKLSYKTNDITYQNQIFNDGLVRVPFPQ